MKTVEKETVIEFEEKKSKFIGYIKPVSTVEEAEKFIDSIKEMHPNATHNVPLYRVVENGHPQAVLLRCLRVRYPRRGHAQRRLGADRSLVARRIHRLDRPPRTQIGRAHV